MKKYSVCVNVNMDNWFQVFANSEEEAAEKMKAAMDDIMTYGVSYETETEGVNHMFGCDTITIGEVERGNSKW